MPLVRIADFGKAALNTDVQPTLLEQGEWTTLDNIDLESGDIRSAWGDTLITSSAPILPKYTFVYAGTGGTFLIISDGTRIYAFDGETWDNVTPLDAEAPTNRWDDYIGVGWDSSTNEWDNDPTGQPAETGGVVTFTVFLGTLVVNFSGGTPAYWPDVTQRMTPLPGWPAGWRTEQIIAYRNFLFAIGLNDNGITEGPKYTFGWSDAAAEGTIPDEWQATAENQAGLLQLRDTQGYITLATPLRDDLVIYKNDSIYRVFYTGGELIFGVERVVSDHGCDSRVGVSGLANVHFFADRGDIRVFDGQGTKSVAISRIKERLAEGISNEFRDQTIVVAYPERDEVWVAVVPAGSSTADTVLVYSTVYDAWTTKRYSQTVSMVLGPFSASSVSVGGEWDDYIASWDSTEENWNQSAYEPSEDGMIFGSSGFDLYRADKTNTTKGGFAKQCIAERSGFVLPDIGQRVTVRGIIPEMEGSGTVQIQIGAQWHPGDNIRWTDPQSFTPGVSRKLNVRITGQPVAFRIKSAVTAGWRLGALSFNLVQAGLR